jgi:hypothetical protein
MDGGSMALIRRPGVGSFESIFEVRETEFHHADARQNPGRIL